MVEVNNSIRVRKRTLLKHFFFFIEFKHEFESNNAVKNGENGKRGNYVERELLRRSFMKPILPKRNDIPVLPSPYSSETETIRNKIKSSITRNEAYQLEVARCLEAAREKLAQYQNENQLKKSFIFK